MTCGSSMPQRRITDRSPLAMIVALACMASAVCLLLSGQWRLAFLTVCAGLIVSIFRAIAGPVPGLDGNEDDER